MTVSRHVVSYRAGTHRWGPEHVTECSCGRKTESAVLAEVVAWAVDHAFGGGRGGTFNIAGVPSVPASTGTQQGGA